MTVDRHHRDCLALAIRQYMAGETTAFTFDQTIHEIWDASDDATIAFVVGALWYHYDDCKDHPAILSKEEWDYFHRLLLILESDAHVQVAESRSWGLPQLVALIGLLAFCVCAVRLGFGDQLFVLAIPFGVLSVSLSFWNRLRTPKLSQRERSLYPFSSAAELLSVRRSVKGFMKQRYPEALRHNRIRSPLMDRVIWVNATAMWFLFSPIVLFVQALPERSAINSVRVSL